MNPPMEKSAKQEKCMAEKNCTIAICFKKFHVIFFCGICRRQCHYEFNTVFWKSRMVFFAKPKEVDPY